MTFSASGLPAGLKLDRDSGVITGRAPAAGEYILTLRASNAVGATARKLRLVSGERLALTPPMGWSSWFAEDFHISDRIIREQADLLVKTSLTQHGYAWINIDDGWAVKQGTNDPDNRGPAREADGSIRPNLKFPDMQALTAYVHARGLKIGIYSSPGPATCGGYPGSYGHEEQDARTFAGWGFDFLKYDWCSYGEIAKGKSLAELQKPYRLMANALRRTGRDFVYSLCQYGMGNVWEWGREVGGHLWRTTYDIAPTPRPVWDTMTGNGFSQSGKEQSAGPGGWNDPDFLLVGHVRIGEESLPTPLTPDEQYFQVSLWAMLSAPLLISADLNKMDDFTLSLLTNDEVIAVNQDTLGRQASRVAREGPLEVWAKNLDDGGKAVALFNRSDVEETVAARWHDLGVGGRQTVRDLWRQKDLGTHEGIFEARVPRHGVVLVKLAPLRTQRAHR